MRSTGGTVVGILSTSMRDLAKELDVGYATVRAWAAGTRHPGRENQERLGALARKRARQLLVLAYDLEHEAGSTYGSAADDPLAEHRALRRENRALVAALSRQAQSLHPL